MRNRTRSSRYVLFYSGAILVAVGVGWFIAKRSTPLPSVGPPAAAREAPGATKRVVHLYFGDTQGRYLVAEQRVVGQPVDDTAFGRQLVQALIQGPQHSASPTMPKEARLRALYVTSNGTAYVDFDGEAFARHPGGVGTELLSIYSVVNTLVLNVETIRCVKILIGGQETATLAGHVDLQHPFAANMLWVR